SPLLAFSVLRQRSVSQLEGALHCAPKVVAATKDTANLREPTSQNTAQVPPWARGREGADVEREAKTSLLRQREHGQEQAKGGRGGQRKTKRSRASKGVRYGKLKWTRINSGSEQEVKTPTRTPSSPRVRTVVLRGPADGDLGPASVSEGDQRVVRWGERRRRRDTERG
ncbi:hypothetical protein B0H13DRAFT_2040748, partial [Mycena leptocephala]